MITFRSADTLNVSASPQIIWSLDGEKADFSGQIRIENLRHRIHLVL